MKEHIAPQNKAEQDVSPENEIYSYYGETDDEIILQMKKRRDENQALKKLLENLNSTILNAKSKKDV